MLRRVIAAAFTLAALTIPAGATSAVADEYGPDEFPCDVTLADGTVLEGEDIDVAVTCEEGPAEFEAAGVAATTPTMADAGTMATPMVTGVVAMTMPVVTHLASTVMPTTNGNGAMATLMITDHDGKTVYSQGIQVAQGESTTATIPGLEPGDYWISLVDAEGEDLADPASLTVVAAAEEPGDGLAVTGPTGLPYLAVAGGLLVVGITALVAVRRARGRA
ncbi:hypothetical protein [Myceligenerans salitolerans]|uniref:Bacterial Ig-like domain-containing protein n=1 Tax=Myceligenerans salitolerans TaxID=1230528 RepID=A0ABS3ID39_9MICO|nr:hypothetical protein [Myceligenerans salitolerans]MBO0610931.1 hypothetical protein [Myceligenerans salitolerans]